MFRRPLLALSACLAMCLGAAGPSQAASYPTKPIHLVLPYNPGGIVDYVGRVLAQYLGEKIGEPVIAENRPGAGGIAGTDAVARATPDGYTLVLMDPAIVINPTLQPNVPYDLFKQLDPISVVSSSPEVLVVTPALKVKTLAEFVAYGKAHPGALNFASAGIGTTPHLGGEMFKQATGIDATHIPYKGIGSSFSDMMANKVQFAFSSIAGAQPFTQDNRLIALATTGEKRSEVYPNLPTMIEGGFKNFSVDLWLTVFAPTGLPADVRTKLNKAINDAAADPKLKVAFAKVGVSPRGTSSEEAKTFIKTEYDKWKKVIDEGHIKN